MLVQRTPLHVLRVVRVPRTALHVLRAVRVGRAPLHVVHAVRVRRAPLHVLGPNSMETFQLEFRLEKPLEIWLEISLH